MSKESKENDFRWYPSPRYLLRKKLILRCLKKIKCANKSILEIGFGAGDTLCSYVKLGMNVKGYDYSEIANKEAYRRLKEHNYEDKVELIKKESDIAEAGYDVVAACEVLEHIEDDEQALTQWNRYIKNNGYLLITVPSRMKKWCLNDEWSGHYRRYEKKELKDKLNNNGFEVINFYSYPVPINIVLDYLLEREKKREGGLEQHQEKQYSKEQMTKESGVKREAGGLARMLSKEWLMTPWHWLQLLFINTDLGSGYVVLSRKITEK